MAASDAFYNEIVAEVDSVLDEFGTAYTIRSPGTYDPDTLSTSAGSTRAAVGVVATQSDANSLGAMLFAVVETASQWVGKKSLILKASTAPQAGEEIQVDGSWFPLSKVIPIKPADVVVVYMLDVSR